MRQLLGLIFSEAAAVVLAGEGHENKIYELAGDEAYTLTELAEEISHQTGKTIPFNNLTETQYADILKSFGLPEGLAQMLADSDSGASKGGLFDDTKTALCFDWPSDNSHWLKYWPMR